MKLKQSMKGIWIGHKMICFKDRTFCISENCTCEEGRKYTEKVRLEAQKWWGSDDAPIAMGYLCGHGEEEDGSQ